MQPASKEARASVDSERLDRALVPLQEALEIIDLIGEFPELGAELNDVIEKLREKRAGQ